MKSCEEYALLVEAFLDGQLSQEEDADLREHLADCPNCQAYLQELLTMQSHFPTVEEVALPPHFTAMVMDAVRSAEAAAPQSKPRRQGWKVVAPLAACLALVVVLGSQGLLSFGENSVSTPQSMASNVADSSPETAPAAEDAQVNNELAKEAAPPVSEEDAIVPATEDSGSAVLTMQPPTSQYGVAPPAPAERNVDVAPTAGTTAGSTDTPSTGPAAFDNSPQIGTASVNYVAELRLTKEEAGDLLLDYTPLESTAASTTPCMTQYVLTVPEMQSLLANFPDKTLDLPADGAGMALVVVTDTTE